MRSYHDIVGFNDLENIDTILNDGWLPEGWSVESDGSTQTIVFKYNNQTVCTQTSSTLTVGESTFTIYYESAGYAFASVHEGDNGNVVYKQTPNTSIPGNSFIFTKDEDDNPVLVVVTYVMNATPKAIKYIAIKVGNTFNPVQLTCNTYLNQTQTQIVNFVIPTDGVEVNYTPQVGWLPVTNCYPSTGQATYDYVPVKDLDNQTMFFDGFTVVS